MNEQSDLERIRGGEGSKFNNALADLERQHLLLLACNEASINGDFNGWCNNVNALYRELVIWANPKERVDLEKHRITNIPHKLGAGSAIRNKLNDFEIELRMFRAKKKLGIIAEEDASTAALR